MALGRPAYKGLSANQRARFSLAYPPESSWRAPIAGSAPARRPRPRRWIGRCRSQRSSCAAGAGPGPRPGCPWSTSSPSARNAWTAAGSRPPDRSTRRRASARDSASSSGNSASTAAASRPSPQPPPAGSRPGPAPYSGPPGTDRGCPADAPATGGPRCRPAPGCGPTRDAAGPALGR
jgi:hypothetical protein